MSKLSGACRTLDTRSQSCLWIHLLTQVVAHECRGSWGLTMESHSRKGLGWSWRLEHIWIALASNWSTLQSLLLYWLELAITAANTSSLLLHTLMTLAHFRRHLHVHLRLIN